MGACRVATSEGCIYSNNWQPLNQESVNRDMKDAETFLVEAAQPFAPQTGSEKLKVVPAPNLLITWMLLS